MEVIIVSAIILVICIGLLIYIFVNNRKKNNNTHQKAKDYSKQYKGENLVYFNEIKKQKCPHCGTPFKYNDIVFTVDEHGMLTHKEFCKKCYRAQTIARVVSYFGAAVVWLIVILVIDAALIPVGIRLGAIPMVIIGIIVFFIAKKVSNVIFNRRQK